jgi:cell wall-associated NlpC family hydrolase
VIDGRKRVASVMATLCIGALGGSVLIASPSQAEPTIADVRTKVDTLYHEAEQASERYNTAKLELNKAQDRLEALQADLDRQQEQFGDVRDQVAAQYVAQYQSQGLSTAGEVFLSEDPDTFLSQLATVSAFNDRQSEVLRTFVTQAKQLELRETAAERALDEIEATEKKLAEDKATIDEKAADAKELLARLEAEQRERMVAASRSGERVPASSVPASGRAKAVVAYALAQVGDAYVWGATGPDAFDCSGFTMASWGQVGVGLPHSSSAQRGYGTSVSASQLQPGDLVFYYSPISHVGIYIGNGMIVHAGNPSTGVRVDPLHSMPFVGATRPG